MVMDIGLVQLSDISGVFPYLMAIRSSTPWLEAKVSSVVMLTIWIVVELRVDIIMATCGRESIIGVHHQDVEML